MSCKQLTTCYALAGQDKTSCVQLQTLDLAQGDLVCSVDGSPVRINVTLADFLLAGWLTLEPRASTPFVTGAMLTGLAVAMQICMTKTLGIHTQTLPNIDVLAAPRLFTVSQSYV